MYPFPFLAAILFSEDLLLSLASSAATLEPRLPMAWASARAAPPMLSLRASEASLSMSGSLSIRGLEPRLELEAECLYGEASGLLLGVNFLAGMP